MSTTVDVKLTGRKSIRTTITTKAEDVDAHIRKFMSNNDNYKRSIGFDTKRTLVRSPVSGQPVRNEIAILQLCDGDTCLIIQLKFLNSFPTSLINFLCLPEYTFMGFGIKEALFTLEKDYGLCCTNAVELKDRFNYPSLYGRNYLSSDFLTGISGFNSVAALSTVFDDWGNRELTDEQVQCAVFYSLAFASWK